MIIKTDFPKGATSIYPFANDEKLIFNAPRIVVSRYGSVWFFGRDWTLEEVEQLHIAMQKAFELVGQREVTR